MNSLIKRINIKETPNIFCRYYGKLITPLVQFSNVHRKTISESKNVISLNVPEKLFEPFLQSIDQDLLKRSTDLPNLGYSRYKSFKTRDDAALFYKQATAYANKANEELKLNSQKHIEKLKEEALQNEIVDISEETKKKRKIFKNPQHNLVSITVLSKTIDPIYKIGDKDIPMLPRPQIDQSKIFVVEDISKVDEGIKLLLGGKTVDQVTLDDGIVLGFDVEWPALSRYTTKQKPKVSLVSFSNGEDHVLFRVCNTGLEENSELGKLLKSEIITKTGFGAGKDANKIMADYGFLMNGIYDLTYTPKIRSAFKSKSSCKVIAGLFDVNLSKTTSLNLSNWGTSRSLTDAQINSSASSVFYSIKTYFILPSLKVDTFNLFGATNKYKFLDK
ncbi:hypothetical protein RB653_000610 [Dictyostelium firmibasis]|uniref:3'-5' exonuclease n=1 Tax=Dictyostelium firmibasis TaxID=79012 RepID=A0AAN7TVH6_9MYCE